MQFRRWLNGIFTGSASVRSRTRVKQWQGSRLTVELLEERRLMAGQVPIPSAAPTFVPYEGGGTSQPDGGGSPPSTALTPAQLQSAYGFTNISFGSTTANGSGQTIALIDAYNDPNIVSDLNTYDAEYLGSNPAPASSFFSVYGVSSTNTLSSTLPSNASLNSHNSSYGWDVEESLDVELAHALAPGAKIILVEASSSSDANLFAAVQAAKTNTNVSVISMSFGGSESSGETSYDSDFTSPNSTQGITFLASTGDDAAPAGYPSYSPNVVAVGGTTLTLSGNTYVSEVGWSDSGGGISSYESKPSYQSTVTQSTTKRTAPDVSFDADPNTGVALYDSYSAGGWEQVGGTSMASPSWAALIAIADQGRVLAGENTLDGSTQTLPALYAMENALDSPYHDITSGNNGYSAGAGYDLVTGIGTPVANLIVSGLINKPTPSVALTTATVADAGQTVTLKATVTPLGSGTPSGTVGFYDNGTLLGSGTLNGVSGNDQATWSSTTLALGSHSFTAVYSGDSLFTANTSNASVLTVAGTGTAGSSGDGGPATAALVNDPEGLAVDASGDVFFADTANNRIQEIVASTGQILTVAGTGTAGSAGDGSLATAAQLNGPQDVVVDSSGDLFIADTGNSRIQEVVKSSGDIITVAGTGTAGYSGDNGAATSAEINAPAGVALDTSGNLYIADTANNRIRKVVLSTGVITTVAGSGTAGYSGDGGSPTSAKLDAPVGVVVDTAGDIFIADTGNNRVREVVKSSGLIVTVAGTGTAGYNGDNLISTTAEISKPTSLALDASGDIFLADTGNNRIREILKSTGQLFTVAGSGSAGTSGDGGPALSAQFNGPEGVAVDAAGDLFIADTTNQRIRKVPTVTPSTINPALAITTTTLPADTVSQPYNQTLGVSGGTAPVTFAVSAGNLPAGLNLNNSTGAITGTPSSSTGSPFAFTITATDAVGGTASHAYSVIINPALSISPTTLPTVAAGTAYNQTLTVTGGTTPYSTFTVTGFTAGTTGLTSSFFSTNAATGTITLAGTPSALGSATFTVNVTDSVGATLTQNFTLTVTHPPTFVTLFGTGPDPSLSGLALSFHGTITPSSGQVINGETVTIEDASNGSAVLATPTISNDAFAFTLPALAGGTHALVAVYGGDSQNTSGSSSPLAQVVTPVFQVDSATATSNGVVLTFDGPVSEASLDLYTNPSTAATHPADVTVVGHSSGNVKGSLVLDPTSPWVATFVQTIGLLPTDTYTVTVTSAVQDTAGASLVGSWTTSLGVTTSGAPVIRVPYFARGAGQAVNIPANVTTGIPITLSGLSGALTAATFTLTYDPTLLTISAETLASAASAAGLSLSTTSTSLDAHHTQLTFTISNASGGSGWTPGTSATVLSLTATVPTSAPYLDKAVLNVTNVAVNSASGVGQSAVDEAAYLGDVAGTKALNGADATYINLVIASTASNAGFSVYKDLDPVIIGGIAYGEASVSSTDATRIEQKLVGTSVPTIPTIPTGITVATGADPHLFLGSASVTVGQVVTVPEELVDTAAVAEPILGLDSVVFFDPSQFTVVGVTDGALLVGYGVTVNVDNALGTIQITQSATSPLTLEPGQGGVAGDIALLANANDVGGTSVLKLASGYTRNGTTETTAVVGPAGNYLLTPAPQGLEPGPSQNPTAFVAGVDAVIQVVASAAGATGTVELGSPIGVAVAAPAPGMGSNGVLLLQVVAPVSAAAKVPVDGVVSTPSNEASGASVAVQANGKVPTADAFWQVFGESDNTHPATGLDAFLYDQKAAATL